MIKKRQWGHMVRDAASEWTNGWLGHGELVASWWDEAAGRVTAVSVVSCCVVLLLSGSVFRGHQPKQLRRRLQRQDVRPAVHPERHGACEWILHHLTMQDTICVFICLFVVDTCWLLTHRAPAGRPRPPCAGCWRPREEQHEEMWGAGRDPLPHQCGQLHGRHRKWCHTLQKSSVLCFSQHFSKWRSSV